VVYGYVAQTLVAAVLKYREVVRQRR
jgi:hypothetical protein